MRSFTLARFYFLLERNYIWLSSRLLRKIGGVITLGQDQNWLNTNTLGHHQNWHVKHTLPQMPLGITVYLILIDTLGHHQNWLIKHTLPEIL